MGASGWEYVVPYEADLQAALDGLRRQIFAAGEYISPVTWGLSVPESLDALCDTERDYYSQFLGENGTHSIIDVAKVVPYDAGKQEFGTICAFTNEEYEDLFDTDQPTYADYERVHEGPVWDEYVAGRWTGRAIVLWEDGTPSEIVFWGYSGD